jgi:tetratricopeptide (TPR) repeat protein
MFAVCYTLAVKSATKGSPKEDNSFLERRLFLILACIAITYAFLAGLRTVADYDTGWQLATGRWVVQHHQVPAFDVLSYTARGEHWLYPVGAGVVFYGVFLLGGYTLLSWMSAAACAGAIALLLRRGCPAGAAIAILAVPLIAERTRPRADMFTVVLFAAFLSILWENYKTGRAPLWLLPLLMVPWVNVHFGFAAGLGLILVYVGTEVLEAVCGQERRRAAMQRLRRASGWLAATALVTLINPWGWEMYRALILQERASAEQQLWIAEWRGIRVNWPTASAAFSLGGARSAFFVLLVIAVVVGVIALFRTQFGAAILLLGAAYEPIRHFRMAAVFACVVVVVGGPILWETLTGIGSWIRLPRLRLVLAYGAAFLFAVLAFARSADLVSNRYYFGGVTDIATFGTGLSWWFPQRAAEFIEREDLPGEIFNTYDGGGYISWRLGPRRLDYIDGRDTLFGLQRVERLRLLLGSPPDSTDWEQEASRFNINTIILSLDGIQHGRLKDFCASTNWRPVYLDEVSAVFVRRIPQTEALIERFPVDCATAPLPAERPGKSRAEQFVAWSNAATVLAVLRRNSEALAASEKALTIFPGSSSAHLVKASVLTTMHRLPEAEQELLTASALSPSEFTWSALADFYRSEDRGTDAITALRRAAELQADPAPTLVQLGYYSLSVGHPDDALEAFDEAVRSASGDLKRETGSNSFSYNVATGRAMAWSRSGDPARAVSFQEEAVRLAPDIPQPWLNLAQIYELQGRSADADRAKAHAASLTENQSR